MLSKKKISLYIIIFISLLLFTFYFLLKDYSLSEISGIFNSINYLFIVIALVFSFLYIICESVAFKIILTYLGEKTKFLSLIRYSFIGFYFSAITPSASGGQPMQIYYMKKDKIPVAKSSITLLLCLMSYQIALIILFLWAIFVNQEIILEKVIQFKLIFIYALISNLVILLFILGAIFSKRLFPYLIQVLFLVLKKIKIKNLANKQKKIDNLLKDYHQCSNILKDKPKIFFKISLLYILQLVIRFFITYLIALSLGIYDKSVIDFITLQTIVLFSISALPIPGGVGISESLYILLFSLLIPTILLNSAALITQVTTIYIPVIIGLIFTFYSQIKTK